MKKALFVLLILSVISSVLLMPPATAAYAAPAAAVVPKPAAPSLSAPQNVKAIADTATTIKVSWDAVSGATEYVLYSKEGSADWKALLTTKATSVTLRTNLKHGYNYRFRIYAKDAAQTSPGSDIVLLNFVPPTPKGLKVVLTEENAAILQWDAVPNATGYSVDCRRSSASEYKTLGNVTSSRGRVSGLVTGETYYFRIRAYVTATSGKYKDTDVFSEYSEEVSSVITASATPAPATPTPTATPKPTPTPVPTATPSPTPEPHRHTFEWKSDEEQHWRECTGCGEKEDLSQHTVSEWKEISPSTDTENGTSIGVCTVCGRPVLKSLPHLEPEEKSWFEQNMTIIIIAAAAVLVIAAGTVTGIIIYRRKKKIV